jgi:hypothetical protein
VRGRAQKAHKPAAFTNELTDSSNSENRWNITEPFSPTFKQRLGELPRLQDEVRIAEARSGRSRTNRFTIASAQIVSQGQHLRR